MENYLKELNQQQRKAVEHFNGPSLVIAGAGSGKTRVLTLRIAYILSKNIHPASVLALTFTNKAAREMKSRIAEIIGYEKAKHLWMGTFHSVFSQILRRESKALGYPSNFTIYDTSDSKNLIKSIIKEYKLDDQIYKVSGVYGRISYAKNNLVTYAAYAANPQLRQSDAAAKRFEMSRIYETYTKRCFKAGAMDFDDLLLNINILFRDKPEILKKYQERFRYILVDEYQDTNLSQYIILKKLAESHNNICVVGDDAQSIYSFRGAKIENILNFKNDYPGYQLFKLEQNYRSTQTIVNAANSLITKNKKQIPKKIFSESENGDRLKIFDARTDGEEGYLVVNNVLDTILGEQNDYQDYAILYRTNSQSRIFEEALRKRNIPYKIYGGLSFYQRKEIKDILAYCRLVVNPYDNEALKRIINYPRRGIGNTTVERLEQASVNRDISIWKVIESLPDNSIEINAGLQKKLMKFRDFILQFQTLGNETDAYSLVHEIASKTGFLKELHADKTPEGVSRYENIQELLNGIKEFSEQQDVEKNELTLDKYLQDVALLTSEDTEDQKDNNRVSLMTIHSAKGLEFKYVYIAGVEEDLFPSKMSLMTEKELEEERRLFYVAITRAKKQCVISFARQRYRWGDLSFTQPSRFISEIDQQYLQLPGSFNDYDADYLDDNVMNYSSESQQSTIQNNHLNTTSRYAKLNNKNLKQGMKTRQGLRHHNQNFVSVNKTQPQTTRNTNSGEFKRIDSKKISVGTRVEHQRFGYGKILIIEGEPPNEKAKIEFETSGKKNILLKFARLKIIE